MLLGCVVASAAVLTLGSGCGHESDAKEGEAKPEESLAVTTTTPKVQVLRRLINQPGQVVSYEETPIFAKLPGYLETVNVDIGDKVKTGDLLGELWVPEIEQDVAVKFNRTKQAEADVRQAKESQKAARANVDTWEAKVQEAVATVKVAYADRTRWSDEFKRENRLKRDPKDPDIGVLTKVRVEEAEHQSKAAEAAWKESEAKQKSAEAFLAESKARYNQAVADVEVAKANLAVCKAEWQEEEAWFGYAKITAPFEGMITRRNVHTGAFLQPSNSGTTSKTSEPLFVVMRTDIMRMVVQVPEYDAPLVKSIVRDGPEASDAIIKLQAYPGYEIKSKVERCSWALDNNVRTLRTEIFLKNTDPKHDLQPGMYANVSIIADIPNALSLPSDTILTDGNKHYCFMLEDGKAKRVNVKIGTTNGTITQLLMKQLPSTKRGQEGAWVNFTGNEKVITSKLKSIQDGQPVKAESSPEKP
jgi:RND family efflux transporter MFP subunit